MLTRLVHGPHGHHAFAFPGRETHLHCMIASCGFARESSPSYDWHGLKRGSTPFVLFQYTVAGRGMLRYERSEFPQTPGSAMILRFPHDNRYWLPHDAEFWEFLYIVLYGSEVNRLWRTLISRNGPAMQLGEAHPAIQLASEIVCRGIAGAIESPLEASGLAYLMAMRLLEGVPSDPARESPVDRVTEYCRAHPLSGMTVEDMAQRAGYSRYHFSRMFTRREGIPPGNFQLHLRLDEARRLLGESTQSVKEIAGRTGFCDVTHFTRMFRKRFGVPPGTFRRSGMFLAAGTTQQSSRP